MLLGAFHSWAWYWLLNLLDRLLNNCRILCLLPPLYLLMAIEAFAFTLLLSFLLVVESIVRKALTNGLDDYLPGSYQTGAWLRLLHCVGS